MRTAFAEWGDMVLREMALGALAAIGAAMRLPRLYFDPLGMGQVVDGSMALGGTPPCLRGA